MEQAKKSYFISDVHLGFPDFKTSELRTKKLLQWMDSISKDAARIFIVGDLFDFWFEYKNVIPRGYTHVLSKLIELRNKNIEITIFTGNHDLWMFDFFQTELNINVYHAPQVFHIENKKFFIAHGDGLGNGDYSYKFLKKIFTNPIFQFLFRWLHPDIGMRIAHFWSRKSRYAKGIKEEFHSLDNELLLDYAKDIESNQHHDYYVFGHRHLPLDIEIAASSRYVNLGEWLNYFSYAVFENGQLKISYFNHEVQQPEPVFN